MLKTRIDNGIWLVEHPDHARVAGYLAAHWGGVNGFSRPGGYPGAVHPERWREQVIFAAAHHDNGWWEWEASPIIDERDGWPVNLSEVASRYPDEGFRRWRLGIPRFAEAHPYSALLITMHAFWLYSHAFPEVHRRDRELFLHPLFSGVQAVMKLVTDEALTRSFVSELMQWETRLLDRLRQDQEFCEAIRDEYLQPHVRLLQLFDALSLFFCFNSRNERAFPAIPRGSWDDRVTLTWRALGPGRFLCDPYPFDRNPLQVSLPMRSIPIDEVFFVHSPEDRPLSRIHAQPLITVRFQIEGA